MGKLILNSKLFNNIIFEPFESKNIVFKGPSGTTMGNFINAYDIYNVDGNGIALMYIDNINGSPLITFISDGNDWLNLVTEENLTNYVIPLNAIFQINSTSNLAVLFNLGGNATNYFQGQISIKKQNLGGGKLTAKLIQSAPPFNPASIAGLQAFYNFEQTVPNNQLDSSGNGRHLTYQVNTLNATSTAGKINSCVSFTSSPPGLRNQGSKYRITTWGPNVSSNFSLSVWLKPRSFDAYQHIIGAPFSNRLYIGANGTRLTFNLFNGTVFGVTAPEIVANTWHHYVFIRNGNTLSLYADNIFIGTASVAGQSFSPGTLEFHVGGSGPFNEYYYDGDVDALGVWNVVLTQIQINYLWNNGQGVQMP